MVNVFATGENGFLLNSMKDIFKFVQNVNDAKYIFHFGCPSDNFEANKLKLADSLKRCLDLVQLSKDANIKFVFASSEGAKYLKNDYEIYKKAQEQYIQTFLPDAVIFRIPRVYDKTRNKGLMFLLKNDLVPKSDFKKYVEFITLDMFKKWFLENLDSSGIIEYKKQKIKKQIFEIGELCNCF